jgi:hypothetical protein
MELALLLQIDLKDCFSLFIVISLGAKMFNDYSTVNSRKHERLKKIFVFVFQPILVLRLISDRSGRVEEPEFLNF